MEPIRLEAEAYTRLKEIKADQIPPPETLAELPPVWDAEPEDAEDVLDLDEALGSVPGEASSASSLRICPACMSEVPDSASVVCPFCKVPFTG